MQRPKRRDRYIAVEFADPRVARDLADALADAVSAWAREDRPKVLFIEGRRGLVRCEHLVKDDVVRVLNAIRVRGIEGQVRTIGASGTVRRARLRYFPHP